MKRRLLHGCFTGAAELLAAVREANRNLPAGRRLRVVAGDTPVDWATLKTHDDWVALGDNNVSFALNFRDPPKLANLQNPPLPPSGNLGVIEHTLGSPRLIRMALRCVRKAAQPQDESAPAITTYCGMVGAIEWHGNRMESRFV